MTQLLESLADLFSDLRVIVPAALMIVSAATGFLTGYAIGVCKVRTIWKPHTKPANFEFAE